MIDRKARKDLELALRRYAAGRIDSDRLDETAIDAARNSTDLVVRHIADAQWGLYDDGKSEPLTRTQRAGVACWILFLRSDLDYAWPDRPPFQSSGFFRNLADLLTLGVFSVLLPRSSPVDNDGDLNVWPFRSRIEMRREMRRIENRTRRAVATAS